MFDDLIIVTNPKDESEIKLQIETYFKQNPMIVLQSKPSGVPDAILEARDHVGSHFAVCLGDFFSTEIAGVLVAFNQLQENWIVLNQVTNPESYGVIDPKTKRIIEKPKRPPSNLAVRGFYIYHKSVMELIPELKLSKRQETEITDLNNQIYFNTFEIKDVIDLGSVTGLEKLSIINQQE